MNQKIILIGTILAITAISIPMVISETSPKPEQPNCELPVNATREQIQELINIGCNIDTSPGIWDEDSPSVGNWSNTDGGYVDGTFNIQTQDDLTEIVGLLVDEMYEKEIFLSMKDVVRLTGLDMDRMQITPNDMYGFSSRNSTYHEGYTYHEERNDGTRIQEKFSNNGTLLKSIKIYDEPEKEILILLK